MQVLFERSDLTFFRSLCSLDTKPYKEQQHDQAPVNDAVYQVAESDVHPPTKTPLKVTSISHYKMFKEMRAVIGQNELIIFPKRALCHASALSRYSRYIL